MTYNQYHTRRPIDQLVQATCSVRNLRISARKLFELITQEVVRRKDGKEEGQKKTKKNKTRIKKEYAKRKSSVKNCLRDLERSLKRLRATKTLTKLPKAFPYMLSQPVADNYNRLGFMMKTFDYSNMMNSVMHNKSIWRTMLSEKMRPPLHLILNCPSMDVDRVLEGIRRRFYDMRIFVCAPVGRNVVALIVLRNILKAYVTFRGLIIESVIVRGTYEHDDLEKIDLFTPSQYDLYKRITDNAYAAMATYSELENPILSVENFFTWLHSYNFLFTTVCKKCKNYLRNFSPPTWRDPATLEAFHDECKYC